MYFWKFWQDTRRSVVVYLGALVFFAAIWLAHTNHTRQTLDHASALIIWQIELQITFNASFLYVLVLAFVIGGNSIGADIGKGAGDFLLTRPRSRRYFVWAGWTAGIVELFSLLFLTVLSIFALSAYVGGPVWRQVASPTHFATYTGQVLDVPLMLATIILSAIVMYGLTYFLSIVLRRGSRGVLWSVAVLVGYWMVTDALEKYKGITLPGFLLSELASQPVTHWYLAPTTQIIGWTIVALSFPFAAQLALERSDA